MSSKNKQLEIDFLIENDIDLYYYEKKFQNFVIGGCDEVGRGPLAGPVVSAIVILSKEHQIEGINDSKKLTAIKRESLFGEIIKHSVDWSVGVVNNNFIDRINILQATILSMKLAYCNLKIKPELLLIDAVKIPGLACDQVSIIKGDAKSASIGAASIIAKVFRDELMQLFSKKYSNYEFEKNKGYGTKEHISNIKKYGYCAIHRKSFKINIT